MTLNGFQQQEDKGSNRNGDERFYGGNLLRDLKPNLATRQTEVTVVIAPDRRRRIDGMGKTCGRCSPPGFMFHSGKGAANPQSPPA